MLANKSLDAKKLLGYVPEMPAVYDMLTIREHLEFMLRSYKMSDDGIIDSLLERFELADKKDKLGSFQFAVFWCISRRLSFLTNPWLALIRTQLSS